MSYPRTVTAKLYDTDDVTEISGALANSFGRSFMDELNGLGVGSCGLPLGDANIAQLTRGRYIGIFVAGVRVFTFKIESSPKYDQIQVGEEVREGIFVSGRGHGCVWDEFQIYPDGGLAVPAILDYNYRLFSFASRTFPNIGTWDAAVERYEYKDGISYGARVDSQIDPGADPDDPGDDVVKLYPAPIQFPWPNAPKNGNGFAPTPSYEPTYWVTADGAPSEESIGFHFFRGGFELAGTQQVKFEVTGDNLFLLYLNGVPILGEADDTLVWKGWKDVTLTLPAGFYVVGAVVENVDADVDYNPAGLLLAIIAVEVYPGDVETSETLALLTSSAADLPFSMFSADEWPGYSPSQILDIIGDEAQARGSALAYVGFTGTEFADSNGNDWDSLDPDSTLEFIPSFELKLSDSGVDALDKGYNDGWWDYHFSGDVLELNAYTPGTLGSGGPVATFAHGVNISSLERGEGKPYFNALLVQWAGGFTDVEDSAAVTAYGGRVEGFLSTEESTAGDGQRRGRVELVRAAVEAAPAISMGIEPTSTADCPYEGVNLGDFVTIPGVFGGTEDKQILAFHLDEDINGEAIWAAELNARVRDGDIDAKNLLRSIGGKQLGSAQDKGVVRD